MAENKQQQQLKEITKKLEQGVKELFSSEKYTEYLRVISQFHNYSFSNTLLIAMQKPDATLVAGYGAWQKKFERNVKKGEKAIKIFAPAPRKVEVERDMLDPETQKPVVDENGEVKKETVTVNQPYFKITSVFDVSQTDGKPLPELAEVNDLTDSVEGYGIFFEALKRMSKVPIDFETIEGTSHGFYHQVDKRIAIADGMSEAQNVKTAIHEIAHSRLHDRDMIDAENGVMVDRRTREVQAESIAYTICRHYGIDTSEYSFGYIAGWSEGKEIKELRQSMETIRREADSMIKEIDQSLEEIRQERQKENTVSAIFDYYVMPDTTIPEMEFYNDFDTAIAAYFACPNEKMKSFGIRASETKEATEFLHCVNGIDYPVVDFGETANKSPEIIAVADRVFSKLKEQYVQLAYTVGDLYFSIQSTDGGYDYSLYAPDFNALDGGIIGDDGKPLNEIVSELLEEADLSYDDCRVTNYNELMSHAEQANEVKNREKTAETVEENQPAVIPMYQDYLNIKAENADRIVLYQVGDFFEAFNDDAKTLAKDLDLMLTSRPISDGERVPLIGLPKHALEEYTERIREKGYKLTIAALDGDTRKVYRMTDPAVTLKTALTSENSEPSAFLHGHSPAEIEQAVLGLANATLEDIDSVHKPELLGARVYGSRTREGLFTDNSDIDVVLSYTDPDGVLREDGFFNILNAKELSFDGIKVDINPISAEKSGSLEEYLKRAEEFLDRKEEHIKASDEKLAVQTEKTTITPFSPLTFGEAKEQNKVDEWRASRKATEACAEQFSKEFGAAYHDRRMPEFLKEMADKYGLERCKIVLASTVQLAEHDGRYYPSTKAEAAKVHIPGTDTEDHTRDIRHSYATNCHPVMINSAFRELQKMERECGQEKETAKAEQDCMAPRASVLSRLQKKQKIVNETKTTPAKNEDRKRGVEL